MTLTDRLNRARTRPDAGAPTAPSGSTAPGGSSGSSASDAAFDVFIEWAGDQWPDPVPRAGSL